MSLARYQGIDFTPPEGAQAAARRALAVRAEKPESQRGMTPVGLARARDLVNGRALSPATVRRMLRYFQRHEIDKQGSTWSEQGKGWQAWHGWGGDAAYAWARKVVKQMDARDERATEAVMQSSEQIRGVVHVTEATIQIPEGQSFNDVLREIHAAVEKAVRDAYEDEIEDAAEAGMSAPWFSVEDLYADSAIVHARSYGEEPIDAYHRVAWSRLATGEIATGAPVEVVRRVTYVPKAAEGEAAQMAQEALRLLRSAVTTAGNPVVRAQAERAAEAAMANGGAEAVTVREALYALRRGDRSGVLRITG